MKERPILMTPENAQKVHDGTKTQTRRIIKSQPAWVDEVALQRKYRTGMLTCPYGQVGDRLWIREAVAYKETDLVAYKGDGSCGAWMGDGAGGRIWIHHGWIQGFSAQNGQYVGLSKYGGKWRPSLHMPRWACRTVVELTEIRVERLHDISPSDALAEGIFCPEIGYAQHGERAPVLLYGVLWESINGKDSWALNPWVWVLTFRKVTSI